MTRRLLIVGLGIFVGSVPAHGHHSFAAHYFEDQTVSIEGSVMEFAYRSPHAWVHILARDNDDQMRTVGAEWANPSRLGQQGITKDTLRPGDQVIVTGSPSRDPSAYKMHLKRIERPADGWRWGGGGGRR